MGYEARVFCVIVPSPKSISRLSSSRITFSRIVPKRWVAWKISGSPEGERWIVLA